jgi:hypothetical protein
LSPDSVGIPMRQESVLDGAEAATKHLRCFASTPFRLSMTLAAAKKCPVVRRGNNDRD